MPKPINLTGQRFGKLTALYLKETGRRRKWHCSCDCGGQAVVTSDNLRSGNSKACGNCRDPLAHSHPRHGQSGRNASPTYQTWKAMRRRIAGTDKPSYAGVDIDPRWAEFEVFLSDMGERPEGMTLDRKDNAAGYWKHNCRWATPTEQTRNRRIARVFEAGGKSLPIAEWAKELGITYQSAYDCVRRHNSLEP